MKSLTRTQIIENRARAIHNIAAIELRKLTKSWEELGEVTKQRYLSYAKATIEADEKLGIVYICKGEMVHD